MRIKNLGAILTFLFTGCATMTYFDSRQVVKVSDSVAQVISSELVATMTNAFPPAKTVLFFPHNRREALSNKIEADLRKSGFAVETNPRKHSNGQVKFGYTLDSLDSGFVLRFVAGDNFQVTQTYEKLPDGTTRSTGPLVIRRDRQ